MEFSYDLSVTHQYPSLATGIIEVSGVARLDDASAYVEEILVAARQRIPNAGEGTISSIAAWRRVFASMGLKPTKHRCAAESLLRRLRKTGDLPTVHPLVDLCNAVSALLAIPIATFDTSRITEALAVIPASGSEEYVSYSGAVEAPEPGEIIFRDVECRAHARRWCCKQSSHSMVRADTDTALIVIEAVHDRASDDVDHAVTELETRLKRLNVHDVRTRLLLAGAPASRGFSASLAEDQPYSGSTAP